MGEQLFWNVLEHLRNVSPAFASGKGGLLARRFRRAIHVVDSTTIELVANCMDWAKHRRRKAAAKCHVRLNLQTFLPRFALVGSANESDPKRARELCAGLRDGEIVLFDKAYVDYAHLHDLNARGVFFVARAKENMAFRAVKRRLKKPQDDILADEEILLLRSQSRDKHPRRLRRVVARIEVDGKKVEMTFLSNNFDWAASSVAELYRQRWGIEVFFKQIKQTLQLSDFLGHNANAVRWQIWTALLLYVLMRFVALQSQWGHSFIRFWAVLRASLWLKLELYALFRRYGTAGGDFRLLARPEQAYLPGLS